MDQVKATQYLIKIAEFLKLKGENPFKVRAFEKAAEVLQSVPNLLELAQRKKLTEISGIGKGIAEVLYEFLIENSDKTLKELESSLPPGLLELIRVPGLGPKKALQLVQTLEIRTLRELEYACKENRLLLLKGFGEKVQAKILEGTLFLLQSSGQARWPDQEPLAESLLTQVRKKFPENRFEWAGAYRRKLEVLSQLDMISDCKDVNLDPFRDTYPTLLPIKSHYSNKQNFEQEWFQKTATSEYFNAATAEKGTPNLNPVFWENSDILSLSKSEQLNLLQGPEQLTGTFHNHTTASDGSASLQDMVRKAEELGHRYIGISEHSQSAFYAQGLNKEALKNQKKEIERVQKLFPKIQIFWGIESDILTDGNLDYDSKTLHEFDFVVASIHSRFGMNESEMTERILKAIQNPATTMIGHLTGRLLLGRPGYALNFDRIFKAAADHDVVIEINAHPARLDVDWRHGPALRHYRVKTSINPDAHELSGLEDTRFGVFTAQKALLPRDQILNTWSLPQVQGWLHSRKK